MQGDILTDQAGGILGSLGLMLSTCLGPEKGFGLTQEAETIWQALFQLFAQGFVTRELAEVKPTPEKILNTVDFGDKIATLVKEKCPQTGKTAFRVS